MEYVVPMPLFLRLSRSAGGKKYWLNLNNYHNWHPHKRNRLKKKYSEQAGAILRFVRPMRRIALAYVLHAPTAAKVDRMNYLAVQDKFFCDALQEWGIIGNDDDSIIVSQLFRSGPIDRLNPRVEITIREV